MWGVLWPQGCQHFARSLPARQNEKKKLSGLTLLMKKKQLSAVHYKARPKKLQKLRNSIILPPGPAPTPAPAPVPLPEVASAMAQSWAQIHHRLHDPWPIPPLAAPTAGQRR